MQQMALTVYGSQGDLKGGGAMDFAVHKSASISLDLMGHRSPCKVCHVWTPLM